MNWAIHDSENDKGQRNLHIHVLLTMRSITENGERVPLIDKKTGQQKADKRNCKQWKCQTVESTDWNADCQRKAEIQSLQATFKRFF